jgi:hypothetical protein
MQIQNPSNNHCLFQALHATLIYNMNVYSKQRFCNYIKGQRGYNGQLGREAIALMEEMGVPLDLEEYDAMVHVPPVIDHFNRKYAGHHVFKAFVFGELETW